MTNGGAVEVSLWKGSESSLPSFSCEGKLFLTFLLNVNGKEGISKIYHMICSSSWLRVSIKPAIEGTAACIGGMTLFNSNPWSYVRSNLDFLPATLEN